ncbi:MAG: tRNA lysidine(34) synthetase TilS [Candidatus Marinimicrobia bacterium]|nr:tRNA lysidine(34) synthetase TilS [Candidatus Neomarinimicrobiota bacterium]
MTEILTLTKEKVLQYCTEAGISATDATIIAAISGGVDSMVLAHTLNQFRSQLNFGLVLVHFNHHLQTNAFQMERVCKKFSLKNQIQLYSVDLTFASLKNLESNARVKRYNELNKIAEVYKHAFIFTAHHLDDQIETLFMKNSEGGDWICKIGIREKYEKLRRPLLSIRKSDILSYAKLHNLTWEEDPSNNDISLKRNKVRHCMLPEALKKNPQLETTLLYTSFKAEKKLNQCFIKFKSQEKLYFSDKDSYHLAANKKLLKLLDLGELKAFMYYSASLLNVHVSQHTHVFWKEFTQFIHSAQSGKIFNVDQLQCAIHRDELIIVHSGRLNKIKKIKAKLSHNKNWYGSCFTFSKAGELEKFRSKLKMIIPSNLINSGLYIRNWKKGDKVISATSGRSSLLSDIFTDHKLSQYDKVTQPVIVDSNDTILWIPGLLHGEIKDKEFKTGNTLVTWLHQ